MDHDAHRNGCEQLHDRHVGGRSLLFLHDEPPHPVDGRVEAPALVFLTAEDLHHLLALDGLLQDLRDIAHRALRLARQAAQPAVEAHAPPARWAEWWQR